MRKTIFVVISIILFTTLYVNAGTWDVTGVFMVVDESGYGLRGVDVCFKVNGEGWTSCGTTDKTMELGSGYTRQGTEVNIVQNRCAFVPGGGAVSWRFRKPGYKEVIINEQLPSYEKGTGKDVQKFQKIRMLRLPQHQSDQSFRSGSRQTKSRDTASGYYCNDCRAKLVHARDEVYYCPSCSVGRCSCGGAMRPSYALCWGTTMKKDDNGYVCPHCHLNR